MITLQRIDTRIFLFAKEVLKNNKKYIMAFNMVPLKSDPENDRVNRPLGNILKNPYNVRG